MADRIIVVQKRRTGCFTWIILIVILISAFVIYRSATTPETPADRQKRETQEETKQKQIASEREKQPDRLKLIQSWQREGTFGNHSMRGRTAEVRVRPPWYAADFDDKKAAASVLWAYWYVEDQSLVTLKFVDDMSGKEVAKYDEVFGLKVY